jgi:hypothetical protein
MEISRSGIRHGKIRIQNPGWKNPDPGPGISIRDQQHWFTENVLYIVQYTPIPDGFLVVRCVCAGMRESLTEVISKSLSKLATQSEGGETVIDETLLS